ncbi:MAG: hypothetical protein AB7O24_17595 [Kofleriaceae bacterium]
MKVRHGSIVLLVMSACASSEAIPTPRQGELDCGVVRLGFGESECDAGNEAVLGCFEQALAQCELAKLVIAEGYEDYDAETSLRIVESATGGCEVSIIQAEVLEGRHHRDTESVCSGAMRVTPSFECERLEGTSCTVISSSEQL